MTDEILPAEPAPKAKPARKPWLQRVLRLGADPRFLIVTVLLLLGVGLCFLSRQHNKHSVVIRGWGCHAHLSGADMNRDSNGVLIYTPHGKLFFMTREAELQADSLLAIPGSSPASVWAPAGPADTLVSLSVVSPPESGGLTIGNRYLSALAFPGEDPHLYIGSSATEIEVAYYQYVYQDSVQRELRIIESLPGRTAGRGVRPSHSWLRLFTVDPIAVDYSVARIHIRFGDSIQKLTGPGDSVVVYPRSALRSPLGTPVSLKDSGRLRFRLDCSSDDTVDIHTIPLSGVVLRIDSGMAAVGSNLRPAPQEFGLPVTLRVTGNLDLRVRRIGDQLRFDLTGFASSVRYVNGDVEDPGQIRRRAVEMIPNVVESSRDMFVALAGIIVFFTQLVKFLWDLFKK